MNILVIGNGFDLAHGLPTTYRDFIKYVNCFNKHYLPAAYKKEYPEGEGDLEDDIQNLPLQFKNEFKELIKENRWLNFFLELKNGEKWIDFESEISKVIQALDRVRECRDKQRKENPSNGKLEINAWDSIFLRKIGVKRTIEVAEIERLKDKLIGDLKRLTRCLEIYLDKYVGEKKIELRIPEIHGKDFQCVLSFNYTDTYEKLYGEKKSSEIEIKYDYIHGKVNSNGSLETCNLVLGIDEYLDEDKKRNDNEYIQFKKFYQRIVKKTGCKYMDWIEDAKKSVLECEEKEKQNKVYIFGHSLDVTDGDIIASLINMPNTQTIIYHHNQEAFEKQVCNLVKILGENELIAKVYGHNASIIFEKQKDPKIMS